MLLGNPKDPNNKKPYHVIKCCYECGRVTGRYYDCWNTNSSLYYVCEECANKHIEGGIKQ